MPSVSTTGGFLSSPHENLILNLTSATSYHCVGLSVALFGFFNLDSAHFRTACLSVSSASMILVPTIAASEYPNLPGSRIAWKPSSLIASVTCTFLLILTKEISGFDNRLWL